MCTVMVEAWELGRGRIKQKRGDMRSDSGIRERIRWREKQKKRKNKDIIDIISFSTIRIVLPNVFLTSEAGASFI